MQKKRIDQMPPIVREKGHLFAVYPRPQNGRHNGPISAPPTLLSKKIIRITSSFKLASFPSPYRFISGGGAKKKKPVSTQTRRRQ